MFTRRTKNVLQSLATKLRLSDTHKVFFVLHSIIAFSRNVQIVFDDLLTKGSTRRTAAQKFYALLELKKWQAIEVEQHEPFGPIEICAGARMQETMKLVV